MTMDKTKIREAKLSELSKLLEIEQLIIDAERPFGENLKKGKIHYYDIENLIRNDNSIVLVAISDDQIIASGYAKVKESRSYLEDDYHAYLGFMYVAPNHRGKGINKLLIRKLVDWGKEKGMTVFNLEVLNENTRAINAYKKMGFQKKLVEMIMNLDD